MCHTNQIITAMASVCVPIWVHVQHQSDRISILTFYMFYSFRDTLSIPVPNKIFSQKGTDRF